MKENRKKRKEEEEVESMNRSRYVVFIMCDEYKIMCIEMNYVWWYDSDSN